MQMTDCLRRYVRIVSILVVIFSASPAAYTQERLSAAELKKLSIEELMNIRVTLATRTPQRLTETASAIQVISGEDIRRSGAANLPDALRLLPNVQVGQLNSSAWIIGVRGFNTIFANKLLVMIDGRTIYTPLFGGVIWDLQHVLLEDVDRIEVVSGPGGSLWGANAVNGVINIITKSSKNTQGTYVSAAAGNFIRNQLEFRNGGKLGKTSTYRIYGMHMNRRHTFFPDGEKNTDAWKASQLGFRMDFAPTDRDEINVHGDLFFGERKTTPEHSGLNGQNLMGTWTRKFSPESDVILSVYYDRYFRKDAPGAASDEMNTADVDFQHRLPAGKRHELLWGVGYRYVRDHFKSETQNVAILPPKKNLDLANAFVQDQFSISDKLKLTAGTKVLHNVYTGLEIQPSIRAAFHPTNSQTLWAAVSRAIRTPSRFDRDYYLPAYPVPPANPSVAGGPDFESEKVNAYELGYRVQPTSLSSFAASAFYSRYPNLYSVEPLPGTLTYQIMNGSEGNSWGVELTGVYQVTEGWRVRTGYTYIDRKLSPLPGHDFNPEYLANDAKHRFLVHSILDLPGKIQFDIVGRYVDDLKETLATVAVPDYFMIDARIALVSKYFEFSVVGQHLSKKRHAEFGKFEIPRTIYAKIAARF